jgi:hypothetical protein
MNTAHIPIVLIIGTPAQVKPSFISENISFGSRTPSYIGCKN